MGQSKRLLATQIKEHQKAAFTGDCETSALAEQAMKTGHEIDWTNSNVLASCQFLDQRLYLESWYIHQQQNSLNREQGPLPSLYQCILTIVLFCYISIPFSVWVVILSLFFIS